MKRRLASFLKALIDLAPLSVVAAGCAGTLCVKLVDASNGRPLAGVSTSWQQYYHGYFHLKREGPTNLPPTVQDGLITVGDLHRNWSSSFIFACPGYSNVYGELTSKGKLILADKVEYYPSEKFAGQFYLKEGLVPASQSNGCFVVPLPKSGE